MISTTRGFALPQRPSVSSGRFRRNEHSVERLPANRRTRRLGMTRPQNPDAEMLDQLEAYEREACGYSQQALLEAGVTGLDQWLADYSACDLAFLRHVYTTGERWSFRGFWRTGCLLIEPRAIPPFTPRRWRVRDQAIVT